jgi:hypothetical protein
VLKLYLTTKTTLEMMLLFLIPLSDMNSRKQMSVTLFQSTFLTKTLKFCSIIELDVHLSLSLLFTEEFCQIQPTHAEVLSRNLLFDKRFNFKRTGLVFLYVRNNTMAHKKSMIATQKEHHTLQ